MAEKWIVRNGQLFCACPAVREGKKEILETAKMRLVRDASGRNIVIASCGRKELRLTVVDTTPTRESEEGDFILTSQGFVVEHDDMRLVFEFEIERRPNEAKQIEMREQHSVQQARWKEDKENKAAEKDKALQLVRTKLVDEGLIRTTVEGLRLRDHNKLWQRPDRCRKFVVKLLLTGSTVRTKLCLMSVQDLPPEEIEEVRVRLWKACEDLRSARKAVWLSAHAK